MYSKSVYLFLIMKEWVEYEIYIYIYLLLKLGPVLTGSVVLSITKSCVKWKHITVLEKGVYKFNS